MNDPIKPYEPQFPSDLVDDLRRRLSHTRLPDEETVGDWSQGIPLSYLRELVDSWRDDYDMTQVPNEINRWPNYLTSIDDIDIHFIHVRSPHTQAQPLLLTHGWPGSVLEFRHVIERLTNPTAFGGTSEQAFHLVIPSLPGYGFSGKPRTTGIGVDRIAAMWITLMNRLGYAKFIAHGGDWGALITQAIALQKGTPCQAIHITLPVVSPDPATMHSLLPEEQSAMEAFDFYQQWESGYSKQQSTRPQTLGYGLADSPSGQLAWIVEKYGQWTDCLRNGTRHPENAVSRNDLLDTVTLYWMTNSGASSARLYWESFNTPNLANIDLPTGISLFPVEIFRTSRRWAEKRFTQLVYFNNAIEHGGHFAALETPELWVAEIQSWHAALEQEGFLRD